MVGDVCHCNSIPKHSWTVDHDRRSVLLGYESAHGLAEEATSTWLRGSYWILLYPPFTLVLAQKGTNMWVASVRDFEDVMHWYGAPEPVSNGGNSTSEDPHDKKAEPLVQGVVTSFPVTNLRSILMYMRSAIRLRFESPLSFFCNDNILS